MNKKVEHDISIFPKTTPPSHLSQTMTMNRGYYRGAGPSRKGRFAALFLENRPRKNLLFLLFRPLLLFFEGLFRVEIYKLEQNRADQLFYR